MTNSNICLSFSAHVTMMTVDGPEDLDENSVYEQLAAIRSAFEDLIDRLSMYSVLKMRLLNNKLSVL